ncbi:dUTP diphosphatase [Viridibacillus sp. YIM B01967]|uniref:dUTP diphosphatase n=1 Tax=Viridibacillus soli TaxID=2798301 RepID=A0ABS1H2K5_9BACL|nr:dUTP diphosphatase [Viridibacillus soli]MBK3493544.1 dUTP diphosphatase [Viridibacillus soli]
MNLQKLFTMQQQLDAFIEETQHITKDVFREKGLALLVELGELANETRCFKFWSTKGPSERSIILEEFVDSIHFLLSLGIKKGFDDLEEWPTAKREGDMTDLFIQTEAAVLNFIQKPERAQYEEAWILYGALAEALDFTAQDIVGAYIAKNEKNYERQRNGY